MLSQPREPRRRGSRTRVRLLLLIITALALITLDYGSSGDGAVGTARDGTLDVLGPVRSAVGWVLSPFQNGWRGIADYDELETENARLRAELDAVRGEDLEVAELQRHLRALEMLLEVRGTESGAPRVVARVIDAPLSNFERTIEIDVGSSDGVTVGMPVESGSGLVGRVVQVGNSRSRVELLTDPAFGAGVRLVRSGDAGVIEGSGSGELLTTKFIDLETVVIPGETVVTSGLEGSVFPAGLVVGTVVTARADPVTGSQEVDVAPAADLERLDLVQVVLYEPVFIDNRGNPPTTTSTSTTTPVVTIPRPTTSTADVTTTTVAITTSAAPSATTTTATTTTSSTVPDATTTTAATTTTSVAEATTTTAAVTTTSAAEATATTAATTTSSTEG
ncbi:MAG: rod shape-determining protein MreC [Actinomycetia bacterium]|nr:rod shape-determining protein MreC [Actinomycetes bacterium]MCP4958493.1 rod shape-determining protein MreC [Actinomycetes bacterium]